MEDLEITQTTNGIQIEGFPDAVKFVQITEPKAKRITDLALHRTDLKFALECLEGINLVAEEPASLRQGLWLSAIVTFMKCFGKNKSRGPLSYKKIYKGKKVAKEVVEYFKSLRNKHLVHDDNSYAQCQTGAVLNKRECDYKIAKIICRPSSEILSTALRTQICTAQLLMRWNGWKRNLKACATFLPQSLRRCRMTTFSTASK